MKKIIPLLLSVIILASTCLQPVSAGSIQIPGTDEIEDVSITVGTSGNAIRDISDTGFDILRVFKLITMGLFVIFLVYIGAQMIMSMGSNEEELSKAKRQIWYALVALIFINIPGTLYKAFYKDGSTKVGNRVSTGNFENASSDASGNLLFDVFVFGHTVNDQIIMFFEIALFMAAIVMLVLAGMRLMFAHGEEDGLKEARDKFIYTVIVLVFIGVVEMWKRVAFDGRVGDGIDLFESIAKLALFFMVPVAILFTTLAAYYYITSDGDEDRIKRAKNIIINTLLGSLIVLASYAFLVDLSSL